jgi:hypothetical protein
MEGGVLTVGNTSTMYFCCVNNTGKLEMSYVQIQFKSELNSFIYTVGGTIIFENLKMDKVSTYWVRPIVDISSSIAAVTVECHSCNVTNCIYKYTGSTTYNKSSLFFFSSAGSMEIFFNMTSAFFYNNSFNLTGVNGNDGGGICYFNGNITSSSKFLFFIFYVFFSF